MYKTMANFFNDNFTKQEEYFIQKIIQTFKGFKTSNYFHSQLQQAIISNNYGDVGKLIELIIKNEFLKQHSNYDKNLSSEPYLQFSSPKIDLKYHDNNLQIKTISFNNFYNDSNSNLINTKFNTTLQTTTKINLSTNELQEKYRSFIEKHTTLTLFIIYEFENNFFNYHYFFLSKNKLMKLLSQKDKQITFNRYNWPSLKFLKPTKNELKKIELNKIKIDNTKIHIFQNELKFNLNFEYLKTIQRILNSKNFLKEFFNLIKKPILNYDTGLNGDLIESLFTKHLNENKYFKNLLLNQSCIKQITNIPVDCIINNNFFQLKTINLKIERLKFTLFQDSNFPKNESFEEKINFYNSKICNTLILTYCEKEKTIIPYFLTYKNLLIDKNSKNKNKNRVFNFELLSYITTTYHKIDKAILVEISKKHQQHEQYLLSNQIKKLEQ